MKVITPIEALSLLKEDQGSIIIDVRFDTEWANGVVDISSINKKPILLTITPDLEMFGLDIKEKIEDLSTSLLFCCAAGHRSATAASIAEKLGYSNCYNISGGFIEWVRLGLPSMRYGE